MGPSSRPLQRKGRARLFQAHLRGDAPLKRNADVVLEIGDGQAEKVLDLGAGSAIPRGVRNDLAGSPRAVLLVGMKTVSPRDAVAALRAGNVAIVPTETVVGLVAAESGLPGCVRSKAGTPTSL